MSDILEVQIINDSFEVIFNDAPLEVVITEDNLEVLVSETHTEITFLEEELEILTIAEQGPPGVGGEFPITIGNLPPSNPEVWDLWLDTN